MKLAAREFRQVWKRAWIKAHPVRFGGILFLLLVRTLFRSWPIVGADNPHCGRREPLHPLRLCGGRLLRRLADPLLYDGRRFPLVALRLMARNRPPAGQALSRSPLVPLGIFARLLALSRLQIADGVRLHGNENSLFKEGYSKN